MGMLCAACRNKIRTSAHFDSSACLLQPGVLGPKFPHHRLFGAEARREHLRTKGPTPWMTVRHSLSMGSTTPGSTLMKNGIYQITFTTTQGLLGTAAVLIEDNRFFGADSMQFYRGVIDEAALALRVTMDVTRHSDVVHSAFGDATSFFLVWSGSHDGAGKFTLVSHADNANVRISAAGQLVGSME
ncbi:MAG: hypothetical protein EOP20_01840 [Hyphomicrobiales bacterium]|nr:MAG: hypothetical protein EOP20_01840 [Hyphomicrobiales bacterium]